MMIIIIIITIKKMKYIALYLFLFLLFFFYKSKDLMYNVIIYYEERKTLKSDLVYESKIDK